MTPALGPPERDPMTASSLPSWSCRISQYQSPPIVAFRLPSVFTSTGVRTFDGLANGTTFGDAGSDGGPGRGRRGGEKTGDTGTAFAVYLRVLRGGPLCWHAQPVIDLRQAAGNSLKFISSGAWLGAAANHARNGSN